MRATVILLALLLSGCASYELTGATYRVQGGRSVSVFWDKEAATTYQVSGEFRVEKKR